MTLIGQSGHIPNGMDKVNHVLVLNFTSDGSMREMAAIHNSGPDSGPSKNCSNAMVDSHTCDMKDTSIMLSMSFDAPGVFLFKENRVDSCIKGHETIASRCDCYTAVGKFPLHGTLVLSGDHKLKTIKHKNDDTSSIDYHAGEMSGESRGHCIDGSPKIDEEVVCHQVQTNDKVANNCAHISLDVLVVYSTVGDACPCDSDGNNTTNNGDGMAKNLGDTCATGNSSLCHIHLTCGDSNRNGPDPVAPP